MELFNHQKEGIKILTGFNPEGGHSFLLADSMGLGKTSSVFESVVRRIVDKNT